MSTQPTADIDKMRFYMEFTVIVELRCDLTESMDPDQRSGAVVLNGVSKRYGSLFALDNISLEVQEGEIFGYVGPNAAGKTTTLKIVVGLIRNFEGEAIVGGHHMPTQTDAVHRMLGYMPQNVAFQEWRTVNHALETFGRLAGLSKGETEERIGNVLGVLNLSDVKNKRIAELSGGTIQKVGLAQALLHSPKLLVLDEPLAGLDPASRIKLKQLIKKLGEGGTTVLFSSHILSDVEDVATRICILDRGRVIVTGSLDELKGKFAVENTIEIVLSLDSGKWNRLESMGEIAKIEHPAPQKLLIRLAVGANADEAIHKVIRLLLESGSRIRTVKLVSPSLDEIYLRLVGGEDT